MQEVGVWLVRLAFILLLLVFHFVAYRLLRWARHSDMADGAAVRWNQWRVGCVLLVGLPLLIIDYEWLIGPLVNPLRRSTEAIEQSLLEELPLGTPRAEVQAWADAKDMGFGGLRFKPVGEHDPMIHRQLGSYCSVGFRVEVFAEWDFGPDDRLISLEINKVIGDAP